MLATAQHETRHFTAPEEDFGRQQAHKLHALSDMECQEGTIPGSESDAIIDTTMAWKPDPDMRSHGLPHVGK